ncbi:MAG TPA: hypothetical protein PLN33_19950 [Hyphomonadaceae bacterium]|nr:hypothetical protein [Hyphomonadaceae bacterium]HPN07620.1 hypothetical protein [Hyphomonadaceae bacterium]
MPFDPPNLTHPSKRELSKARDHILIMSMQTAPQFSAPAIDARRAVLRLFWFTMRFAVYGPLFGFLVLWFISTVLMLPWNAASMGTERAFSAIFTVLTYSFLFVLPIAVAYVMTGIPAALTGLAAGTLSLLTPRPLVYYCGTALAGWISMFVAVDLSSHATWHSAIQWACLGATVGVICAWRARRRMQRNPRLYGIPVTL